LDVRSYISGTAPQCVWRLEVEGYVPFSDWQIASSDEL
jgi:hypothetical protein